MPPITLYEVELSMIGLRKGFQYWVITFSDVSFFGFRIFSNTEENCVFYFLSNIIYFAEHFLFKKISNNNAMNRKLQKLKKSFIIIFEMIVDY